MRFGEHDYDPEIGQNLYEIIQDREVENVIFHPLYELQKGYYDIALLKLAESVEFGVSF